MTNLDDADGGRGRRGVLCAILVGALFLGGALGIHAYSRTSRRIAAEWVAYGEAGRPANDFDRFLATDLRFLHRQTGYVDDGFPNPPIVIGILAPFTVLSAPMAQVVWALCKTVMSALIVVMGLSMTSRAGTRITLPAVGLILFACLWPWIGDLLQGQTNLLMLLPLVTGLWLAQRSEWADDPRRWPGGSRSLAVLGGVTIGLAVCIKVTPIIFLAYFLWRGRYSVAGGIIAGIGLWLFVVPSFMFGWGQNWLWLGQWWGVMILPYFHGIVSYSDTQSMASMLQRLLTHTPAFGSNAGDVYINVANLPIEAVVWLNRLVLGAIAAFGLVWTWQRLVSLTARRWILEIGCLGAFMLWASERTWVHHYVTGFLPLLAAAMMVSDPTVARTTRRVVWLAMIFIATAMMFTSDLGKVFGTMGPIWIKAFGACLWGSIAVVAVIIWAEITERLRGNQGYSAGRRVLTIS